MKNNKNPGNKIVKIVGTMALVILKPFMPLIIFFAIIIVLIGYFVDIFNWKINNEDEAKIKLELAYYELEESFEDIKEFVVSAVEYVTGTAGLKWPVKGHDKITSKFGYRKAPVAGASSFHSGIDIAAPEGTKLIASINGEITKASWGGANGYSITIKGDKYTVSYGHCSPKFKVKVGDQVKKGDVIGNVGPKNVYGVINNPYKDSKGNPTNGATTGCHLHFTVRENGKLIDPETVLKKEDDFL